MTDEQPAGAGADARPWVVWTVCGTVVLLSVGWVFLDLFAMDTSFVDSLSEAVGVACALLVVVAVIGRAMERREARDALERREAREVMERREAPDALERREARDAAERRHGR